MILKISIILYYKMSDCLSVQSNGSLQVNSGKLDNMHEPNLEDRLGFKPDGTNNFLCTVYNSRTKVRILCLMERWHYMNLPIVI